MEIKDRLIKIITTEGLNSSAFADSIGVQRSSISHILSGRNKPSLDFLEKILASYPKYNAEWLIMGTGSISKIPKQQTLFEKGQIIGTENINSFSSLLHTASTEAEAEAGFVDKGTTITEIKPTLNEEPTVEYSKKNIPEANTTRTIDRIVVFYNDRTFLEYTPGR
jgi:transcriptional regulator with XRE-family HTH domain